MTRSTTWHHDLDVFLRSRIDTPFEWGVDDCCLFAADAVQAMTGTEIADDCRGKYTTQTGAFKLIKKLTGGVTVADAIAYCATKHGISEWLTVDGQPAPFMAQRGDLVAVTNGDDLIAGIVDLSGRYVACKGEGVTRLPLTNVVRAWRVG